MEGHTMNSSSPFPLLMISLSQWAQLAMLLGTVIIIVNLFTFIVILRNKHLRENYALLVANLCLCDVINGISLMCLRLVVGLSDGIYLYMYFFVMTVGLFGCQWNTVALSVDRLIAIQCPLRYHAIMTRNKLLAMVATMWLLCISESTGYIVIAYVANSNIVHDELYDTFLFFPYAKWILTFSVNAGIYAHLWRVARRQRRQIAQQQHQSSSGRINKASVIVFVIVGLYGILWFPYGITLLISVTADGKLQERALVAVTYSLVTGYINSVVNGIVYVLLNKELRNSIKKKFRMKCHK